MGRKARRRERIVHLDDLGDVQVRGVPMADFAPINQAITAAPSSSTLVGMPTVVEFIASRCVPPADVSVIAGLSTRDRAALLVAIMDAHPETRRGARAVVVEHAQAGGGER